MHRLLTLASSRSQVSLNLGNNDKMIDRDLIAA